MTKFAVKLTSGRRPVFRSRHGYQPGQTKGVDQGYYGHCLPSLNLSRQNAEKGGLEGGNKTDSLGDGKAPTKDASLTLEARPG